MEEGWVFFNDEGGNGGVVDGNDGERVKRIQREKQITVKRLHWLNCLCSQMRLEC